jgi:phospholipid-translocating ATPase
MECAYRSVKRTLVIMGLGKWGFKWLSARTWRKAFGGWWRGRADTVWGGAGLERSVEEWGVEMWQEMERDPQVREMLRKLNADADGEGEQQEEAEEEEGQHVEVTLEKGKMVGTEAGQIGGLFVS